MSSAVAEKTARTRRPFPWSEVVTTLAAFVMAFLIGAILMIVADPEVSKKWTYFFSRPSDALTASWDKVSGAYGALIMGSVGSWKAFTETTSAAAPLISAGLGMALAFRAGLFNIGAQGQAIMGATLAAYAGFSITNLPLIVHLPLALLLGVLAGALWGGFAGWLRAATGAHEVIVTIMLNYVASLTLAWLLTTNAFLREGRKDPIAPEVQFSATFPRLEGGQLHLGFLLALLAAGGVWWLMERSTVGFRIKAVGANPDAAATAGMSVARTTVVAMTLSGALAGLAGVQAALGPGDFGLPTPLSMGLVGSIGFDAITVALLGRSKPFGVVLAGMLFGAMHAGGLAMQSQADTPLTLTTVLQALIVMFVAAPMLVRTVVPFLKARKAQPPSLAGEATTATVAAVAAENGAKA
ncbi:MAG: ABC transporter permease [Luteococcus sp.]|uniref:ABC transporter permease n=1 Tax=Luteococcus sp. TaxID=1969402 RepID=UPI00264885E1|nr:ABC transporter permease [Luteococcus sp.]MDN5563512.1 ABC transporter permease [Luteococcus sp.]